MSRSETRVRVMRGGPFPAERVWARAELGGGRGIARGCVAVERCGIALGEDWGVGGVRFCYDLERLAFSVGVCWGVSRAKGVLCSESWSRLRDGCRAGFEAPRDERARGLGFCDVVRLWLRSLGRLVG